MGSGAVDQIPGRYAVLGTMDGKVELKGGSKEDRLAAHEWISLFWHEAVIGDGCGRRG